MITIILSSLSIFAQSNFSAPLMEPSKEIYKQFYTANPNSRIFKCNTAKCDKGIKSAWQNGFTINYQIQK